MDCESKCLEEKPFKFRYFFCHTPKGAGGKWLSAALFIGLVLHILSVRKLVYR
jgi:hypothetical protein